MSVSVRGARRNVGGLGGGLQVGGSAGGGGKAGSKQRGREGEAREGGGMVGWMASKARKGFGIGLAPAELRVLSARG